MVATLAQAASAAYYLESQRSFRHPNEYYTAGEEPDGVWFNPKDLFGLGDGGKVDSGHFHRLYHGFAFQQREGNLEMMLCTIKGNSRAEGRHRSRLTRIR